MTPHAQTESGGRIVGDLACQRNSYLQTLNTVVVSCVEDVPKEAKSGKKTKNSGKKLDEPKLWEIEFADSVLFPEGGGQPTDYGTITPISDPSTTTATPTPISVTSVQRNGLVCIHISPTPLPPGTAVRQDIDFPRRWDHMQQHTGQHVLTAIMDTYGDLHTTGWGMGTNGSVNYVDLSRCPSMDEIQEIQYKCNEVIRKNLPITVETPANAKSDRLPGDYDKEQGIIRIIKIGDLHYDPCCGTHLCQTAHISLLLLHHTQHMHSSARLYFTAGERAIDLASASIRCQRSISVILTSGTGPTEVLERVEMTNQRLTELKRREKKLMSEIARFEADRVKRLLEIERKAWVYRADAGLEYLDTVVQEIKDSIKESVLVLAAGGKGGPLVIVGEEKLVSLWAAKAKELVKQVKGGGKGWKWQGKVVEWGKGEMEALKSALQADLPSN